MLETPDSRFVKVKCTHCKNEQTVFNKPAGDVKCLVCNKLLVKATGGRGKFEAKVAQVLE